MPSAHRRSPVSCSHDRRSSQFAAVGRVAYNCCKNTGKTAAVSMCFLPPAVLETAAQTVAKTTGHHATRPRARDDADRRDRRTGTSCTYTVLVVLAAYLSSSVLQCTTVVLSYRLQDCATSTAAPTELYEL